MLQQFEDAAIYEASVLNNFLDVQGCTSTDVPRRVAA